MSNSLIYIDILTSINHIKSVVLSSKISNGGHNRISAERNVLQRLRGIVIPFPNHR